METKHEWLDKESKKALYADWHVVFLRRNAFWIRLYQVVRTKSWARFVMRMEMAQFNLVRQVLGNKSYNDVLKSYVEIVSKVMREDLNVKGGDVTIDAFSETNGYDIFNATSFPAFGVNYIAVNSGIFFHSHTLARSLQPFIMELKLPGFFKRLLIHNFAKSAIGLLSNDHTRSFQSIRYIPEDDGLLVGMELFIVAHEMYHIAYAGNNQVADVFSSYYSPNLTSRCLANEEMAADGFAILALNYYQKHESSTFMLYGPCFLFKLLSLFDEIMGREISDGRGDGHPSNSARHSYVIQMLNELDARVDYDEWDATVDRIVRSRGKKIRRRVEKILKNRDELNDTYREMKREVCPNDADSKS